MGNRKQITVTWLERSKLAPGEEQWRADPLCPGLMARISLSKSGHRSQTWYYRYKPAGDWSPRFVIGEYPGMIQDEARHLVNSVLRPLARAGKDVKGEWERMQAAEAEQDDNTIRTLIPAYLTAAKREGLAEGTLTSYRRYLRPLAHWWGDRDPREINRGDCQDLFYRVQEEGVPPYDIDGTELKGGRRSGGNRAAGLTHSAARAFFTWLEDHEKVDFNPWARQKKLAKRGASGIAERALDDAEIKAVLTSEKLSLRDRTALRMMLATGLRPNEVCETPWNEIDLKAGVWTLPPGRLKHKGSGYTVYLSDYMVEALTAWRKTQKGRPRYVFPSQGSKHPYLQADNLVERLKSLGIDGLTPKVTRSTMRTGLQALGCPLEVRQFMSHHQPGNKRDKSYDKYDFSAEARHWWQQWGIHLAKLDQGKKGLAEVVRLGASA